jgi:hypothetical protein
MHRRIVLFIALLAALVLAAPVGASAKSPADFAPSAAEAQEATTASGPGGVGDQLVPDSGPWFNFTVACANHDACYAAQLGQANCATTRCGASATCSTSHPTGGRKSPPESST